mgnify:CR=1 FL=1
MRSPSKPKKITGVVVDSKGEPYHWSECCGERYSKWYDNRLLMVNLFLEVSDNDDTSIFLYRLYANNCRYCGQTSLNVRLKEDTQALGRGCGLLVTGNPEEGEFRQVPVSSVKFR